ncbi:MAG: DUF3955 domain-containing protein [Coriobacteriia bacterium]|jgi:hypothetical protein|nr:DUF3955 domain-containing protein [Coriobacteriia bacterium]
MNLTRRLLGGFTFLAFFVSIGCLLAYALIGARVNPDGLLVEPFFLVPMAWLFLFIGLGAGLAYWVIRIAQRSRPSANREDAHGR